MTDEEKNEIVEKMDVDLRNAIAEIRKNSEEASEALKRGLDEFLRKVREIMQK